MKEVERIIRNPGDWDQWIVAQGEKDSRYDVECRKLSNPATQLCEHGSWVRIGPVQDQAVGDIARKVDKMERSVNTTWQRSYADRVGDVDLAFIAGAAKRGVKEVHLYLRPKLAMVVRPVPLMTAAAYREDLSQVRRSYVHPSVQQSRCQQSQEWNQQCVREEPISRLV